MAGIRRIGIVGAGAWGTTLGLVAQRAGTQAIVWAYEPEVADAINLNHTSPYLPGINLDHALAATNNFADLSDVDALLLVSPAQHLRSVCGQLARHVADTPVVICTKGIEGTTGALMSDIAEATFAGVQLAVLSGPTFAREVAQNHPAAVTFACADEKLAREMVSALGTPMFRPYRSRDLTGAQVGGALKNVLAIACGIVMGRGLGENARAALITRGMAEILRLGRALGAEDETLMGLSGIGDLVLTCTSSQSRNMSLGWALGQGKKLSDILAARTSVTEGMTTSAAVVTLAERKGIEMPISAAVDAVVNHSTTIDQVIEELLNRPFRNETNA